MAKISALDRAIAVLDGEIKVLELAKARLQQQQGKAHVRRGVGTRVNYYDPKAENAAALKGQADD